MEYNIVGDKFAPTLDIKLNANEQIRIERGSSIYYSAGIVIEGKTNGGQSGGIFKALGRSIVSGESFFKTIVTSNYDNQMIVIAPKTIGEIKELECTTNNHWRINDGAFLASDISVDYEMKRQSIGQTLFANTGGLYVMETVGEGKVFINSTGSLRQINITGDQLVTIDNSNVVAWSSSLNYEIKIASGTFGFKSGEGIVNTFKGTGTIYVQTRTVEDIYRSISPFIQTK